MRRLSVTVDTLPLAAPFVIAGATYLTTEVLVADIEEAGLVGRGEACPVEYKGETLFSMQEAIEGVRPALEAGVGRDGLQNLLGPCGARNALDCALWELEAKRTGATVASLAALENAGFQTLTTISLGPPDDMAAAARTSDRFEGLKLKLSNAQPVDCVAAVRKERPDARLVVDVNGGWSRGELQLYAPELARLGVELIEQPLPVDVHFEAADSPIPICADEACGGLADLAELAAGYSAVCVKLDKTGGLTEAIAVVRAARARGIRIMISNMLGTSLAMAPASLLAGFADWVDLDGPLLLRQDRIPGFRFTDDRAAPYPPGVWA